MTDTDEDAVGAVQNEDGGAVDGPFTEFLAGIQAKKAALGATVTFEDDKDDSGGGVGKPEVASRLKKVKKQQPAAPVEDDRDARLKKQAEAALAAERVAAAREERQRKAAEFDSKRTNALMDKLATTDGKSPAAAKKGIKGELDDTLRSHIEYLRVWSAYQKRLLCQGTGKRLTMATPIAEKHAEVESMREEMRMRRAQNVLEGGVDKMVETVEWSGPVVNRFVPNTSFTGLLQSWQKQKENDIALREAIVELEIEWGSYLGTRPSVYVALAIFKLAGEQARINRRKLSGAAPATADRPEFDDL